MEVVVVSHGTIRDAVGEKTVIQQVEEGAAVAEALDAFAGAHEGIGPLIFDGEGDLRPHINVLVDGENIMTDEGPEAVLSQGDEIAVVPGLSGGGDVRPADRMVG